MLRVAEDRLSSVLRAQLAPPAAVAATCTTALGHQRFSKTSLATEIAVIALGQPA
jgi:hypothetical protein